MRDIVATYVTESQQERLRERYMRSAAERALDVVTVINQPFSYRDVAECVTRVMTRDGWIHSPSYFGIVFAATRNVIRELEDVDLVARVRDTPGSRPHLFVRTDSGPSGRWPS